MFLSNCHTHTFYCDGKNSPEQMAESAVKQGFASLGFSVHSPMNFKNDFAIPLNRLDEYFDVIEKLKIEYKDKIEIYNGIEMDADCADYDYSKFDYTIAAVHQLHCGEKIYSIDDTPQELADCVKKEFDGSFLAMAKQYYSSLASFVCSVKPDVVAHIDLITKFNEKYQLFDESNLEYQMIAKLYIERICLECPDIIFEVNTGAMYRCGNQHPYPSDFILKFLNEHGAGITLSSDSHSVDSLHFGFETAANMIRRAGFHEIYFLDGGQFKPHSII
ncbi:MAG: histidinol-phosphatase HisJ family protein [Acutalibacteraceae bacterium]